MSDKISFTNDSNNRDNLYFILKDCVHNGSMDSLNDVFDCRPITQELFSLECFKMVSLGDSFGDEILDDDGRISLAYENLRSIPKGIAEKLATKTKFLDLSYNNFHSLSFLSFFDVLHTLILDRNPNIDIETLPFLPSLRILWINNCEITNIDDWLYRIQVQCPYLQQLSMMGNQKMMSLINSKSDFDYREYVFDKFPNLLYLDGVPRDSVCKKMTRVPSKTSSTDSTKTNLSSNDSHRKFIGSVKIPELLKRKKSSQRSTTK